MAELPKTKVLIIQNAFASRNVIIYILRQTGLKGFFSATTGKEALAELLKGEFAVVMSDWQMADMDVLELLRTVRETPELKDLLFIIVAAEIDREKLMLAKELGVDGYVLKPFTAEALSKKVVEALKARCKGGVKPVRKESPACTAPAAKVPGQACSSRNWSISMSYMNRMHRGSNSVIKYDFAGMMNIMSLKVDRLKADPVFVPVKELINNITATIKTAELQSEHAGVISKTTGEISKALKAAESAPAGSRDSVEGLSLVDRSASKLADVIESFDKDVAAIMSMLNSMDHMVQQVHIHEINESIKDACAVETKREPGGTSVRQSELPESSKRVAEGLSRIRSESETARESLTTAAGDLSHVIERIRAKGPAARHSYELFEHLSERIGGIMEVLEAQITLTERIGSGMKAAAAVQGKIMRNEEPEESVRGDREVSSPEVAEAGNDAPRSAAESAALKKIWEYRILMIDIVKKENAFSIKDFDDMMNERSELLHEHLPGHPAGSFSKWVDHSLMQQDYYDAALCRQIMLLRDAMYGSACKAFELFRGDRKDEALKSYQKVNFLLNQIGELLDNLQEELRNRV